MRMSMRAFFQGRRRTLGRGRRFATMNMFRFFFAMNFRDLQNHSEISIKLAES
jgi:hypothetical protein